MTRVGPVIGLDRRVDREWLDAAAGLMASGLPTGEVREALRGVLRPFVKGEKFNTALGKTLTVLTRVWVVVPESEVRQRDSALAVWESFGADERLALHWARLISAYPFFRDLVTLAGRFLRLHDQVESGLVVRRMVERWGERSTVPRAAQRGLRSLVEWGVLAESGQRGVYRLAERPRVVPRAVPWLYAGGRDEVEFERSVVEGFPFDLTAVPVRVR